jgi:hypothetical protein
MTGYLLTRVAQGWPLSLHRLSLLGGEHTRTAPSHHHLPQRHSHSVCVRRSKLKQIQSA